MMIVAGWLLHCVVLATVLSAGAIAWELAARWSGRPARWAWLAALAGSVTLPWLLRLLPERVLLEAVPSSMPVLLLEPMAVQSAAASTGVSASEAGMALWLVLSLAMVTYVVVMLLQLSRARRGWERTEVDGARVWVTRGVGPAAVGVRGEVVVPRWALELDAELRRLLLMHEREHVHAGDPRLLLGALMLLALMPWNPVLWVQVLRLRNAIELDCDARVLRTGANPRTYGALLLEVGQRRSTNAFVMATFAEPRLFLEERIRRIARWPQPPRPLRAAALAVVALALFVTAASARDPLRVPGSYGVVESQGDAGGDVVAAPLAVVDTPPGEPTFTPFTKRPELLSPAQVRQAMAEAYPKALRDANIGGRTLVHVFIDHDGVPKKVMVSRTSGYPALDEAALAVVQQMRFTPAMNRDARVAVWIELPVVFTPEGAAGVASERTQQMRERTAARAREDGANRPELLNASEVVRALDAKYPPLLKDAGITGVVRVQLYVGADGRAERTMVSASSGYPALDDAALGLTTVMRFRPATKDGRPVASWIEVPLIFGNGAAAERAARTGDTRDLELPAPRSREDAAVAAQAISPARGAASGRKLQDVPTFTPMTVQPELLNRDEAMRVLRESYPPLLRDAGISGSPVVHFFIDEEGTVVKALLSRSSGYPAMDDAALVVARTMRFTAARNRDRKVPVWVEIPLQFNAK